MWGPFFWLSSYIPEPSKTPNAKILQLVRNGLKNNSPLIPHSNLSQARIAVG